MNLDLWPREKTIQVQSNLYFAMKGHKRPQMVIQDHVKLHKATFSPLLICERFLFHKYFLLLLSRFLFANVFCYFCNVFYSWFPPRWTIATQLLLGPLSVARGQKTFKFSAIIWSLFRFSIHFGATFISEHVFVPFVTFFVRFATNFWLIAKLCFWIWIILMTNSYNYFPTFV